jgi:peptidoglycan DL-endopeptidase CwlO
MPSATVAALAAPIRRVQALVGPGWTADPSGDPAATLADVREALVDVAHAAGLAWQRTEAGWSGGGADAAADFAAATTSAIDAAAERAGGLGVTAEAAARAVADAHRRLQDVVEEFEARASALEPHLDSPGVAREMLAQARDALGRAIAIVEELQAELNGHAAALDEPPPTTPAGYSPGGGTASPGGAPGWAGGSPSGGGFGSPGGFSSPGDVGEFATFTGSDRTETPDAASFGEGVAVRLPDGTVVMAPNALAANAVRHALTQLGVPYQWGGTTPGVGLDCSGLTQWAYREAGLNLPRLAQEQDIGAAVSAGSVLPGDLAVWDGHVAMIVGDGLMVEAGDPIKLSPIRTANAGQGFQGFWRPTG